MFGKKIRLTDEEVDRIAEAVVNKIITKQREIDDAYFNNQANYMDQSHLTYELILQNIIGVQLLLDDYVKTERYEEAEIAKAKLEELRTLLKTFEKR